MTRDGSFDQEPTDSKALDNLRLSKKAHEEEVSIDLINQTLWVRSGHTLRDGSIFPTKPKVRYFKINHPHPITTSWDADGNQIDTCLTCSYNRITKPSHRGGK